MISIQIPTALRRYTGGKGSIDVTAGNVGEALAALARAYPEVGKNILDDKGQPRNFVNIYLGDEDIRQMNGLETPVKDGQELLLVPSIAGGNGY